MARHRIPPPAWWASALQALASAMPAPGPHCAYPPPVVIAPRVDPDLGMQEEALARLDAMLRHPAHGTSTAPGKVA